MAESPKSASEVNPRPDPNEKLVKIFDTEQESEALVVKGLLESAGIDADLTSLSAPQWAGLDGLWQCHAACTGDRGAYRHHRSHRSPRAFHRVP